VRCEVHAVLLVVEEYLDLAAVIIADLLQVVLHVPCSRLGPARRLVDVS